MFAYNICNPFNGPPLPQAIIKLSQYTLHVHQEYTELKSNGQDNLQTSYLHIICPLQQLA